MKRLSDLLCAVVLLGCSQSTNPDAGSQTHFLRRCNQTCQAPYACLCGVCTLACEQSDLCGDEGERAECLSGCAMGATCDVMCQGAADCASTAAGFVCDQGRCRAKAGTPPVDPASTANRGGCVGENPVRSDADLQSDPQLLACAVPFPEPGAPPQVVMDCRSPTAADIEAECAAGGQPCPGAVQISHDAAICLAMRAGLQSGVDGPYAALIYNEGVKRPGWNVTVAGEGTVGGLGSGSSMLVDAETGEVLQNQAWRSMQ